MRRTYILLLWLALLTACATRAERNLERCCNLELGMSREAVVKQMGRPDRTEAYLLDGQPRLYLFYQARDLSLAERQRGQRLREADYLPLLFVDDRLQGWGASLFNSLRLLRPEPAARTGQATEELGRGAAP